MAYMRSLIRTLRHTRAHVPSPDLYCSIARLALFNIPLSSARGFILIRLTSDLNRTRAESVLSAGMPFQHVVFFPEGLACVGAE
jgi:hypothetical protein